MSDIKDYDVLIVVTPADYERLKVSHKRIIALLPARRVYFVGSCEVGKLVSDEFGADERVGFIDENSIISFDEVHKRLTDIMAPILNGRELPRRNTGWYYQQFLKMQYSQICQDEYYMTWDGDTVPCKQFSMFSAENGQPYLDVKEEYHEEYFKTLAQILPGMKKVMRPSFISEHMLYRCDIMQELIREIEANKELAGISFWEKILKAIPVEAVMNSAFSEFETYGTYCALRHIDAYRIREWHSFRLGAEFFHQESMTEKDYEWLGRDFQAISFEKNQSVRADHEDLFNNPKYQEKLSARQMLEIAQEEFEEGYREVWVPDGESGSVQNIY